MVRVVCVLVRYSEMHLRIMLALMGRYKATGPNSRKARDEMAEEDWNADRKGHKTLNSDR